MKTHATFFLVTGGLLVLGFAALVLTGAAPGVAARITYCAAVGATVGRIWGGHGIAAVIITGIITAMMSPFIGAFFLMFALPSVAYGNMSRIDDDEKPAP